MTTAVPFTRLSSSNVLVQAHAAPDSRFMLLPVIERSARISGWLIYDTGEGKLVIPDDEELDRGIWPQLHRAREWIINHYYQGDDDVGD